MKLSTKLGVVIAMLMASAGHSHAQTVVISANFTFAGGTPCSSITSWNGDANAYPYDMGGICLYQTDPLTGLAGSYLDAPWQLGLLNNGYLAACNPLIWQPKVFTLGDGTHSGDTFTVAGATACPYYTGEYGGDSNSLAVGWSVVADYTMVQRRICSRYRCFNYLVGVLTGGSGMVVETRF